MLPNIKAATVVTVFFYFTCLKETLICRMTRLSIFLGLSCKLKQ